MRASGLAWEKWDHRRADSIYMRRHCIEQAAAGQTVYYDPLRPHLMPAFALPGDDQDRSPPGTTRASGTPSEDPDDLHARYLALSHDELARLAVEQHQAIVALPKTSGDNRRRRSEATSMLSNVMQIRRNAPRRRMVSVVGQRLLSEGRIP
jgi:hypothetical protein